eukprot:s3395_g2.t3
MIGVEASAAAAVAAPAAVPERGSERNEGRGDADTATSVAPFSTQRLLHLLSELKEYQVASNHERLEVRCERVEQKTRLARLEQQLLAEEQIGHDLARRIETLEEAIRQERQMQEKSFSQSFSPEKDQTYCRQPHDKMGWCFPHSTWFCTTHGVAFPALNNSSVLLTRVFHAGQDGSKVGCQSGCLSHRAERFGRGFCHRCGHDTGGHCHLCGAVLVRDQRFPALGTTHGCGVG